MDAEFKVGQSFDDIHEFLTARDEYSKKTGTKFIVGSSNSRNSNWKSYTCDRYGRPRQGLTSSKKCDCKLSINGSIQEDGKFRLTHVYLKHENHTPGPNDYSSTVRAKKNCSSNEQNGKNGDNSLDQAKKKITYCSVSTQTEENKCNASTQTEDTAHDDDDDDGNILKDDKNENETIENILVIDDNRDNKSDAGKSLKPSAEDDNALCIEKLFERDLNSPQPIAKEQKETEKEYKEIQVTETEDKEKEKIEKEDVETTIIDAEKKDPLVSTKISNKQKAEISTVIIPKNLRSVGRPKGAITTVDGQPLKKENKKFMEREVGQKIRSMLHWIFGDDETIVNWTLDKTKLVTPLDINCLISSNKIQHFLNLTENDFQLLKNYVDEAAFTNFNNITKCKKENEEFACGECHKQLRGEDVKCDSCLLCFEIGCVGLKKAPKRAWFCNNCSMIFQKHPRKYKK